MTNTHSSFGVAAGLAASAIWGGALAARASGARLRANTTVPE